MRLYTLNSEGISKLIDGMEKEVRAIKKNAQRISWHSRGGVSYTDVMNMSQEELSIAAELIEENMETTKRTKLPFF